MYIYVCVCIYVCMYVCMYMCVCIYMYVCMYIYMYVCIYIYVCMYVCIYIYMYIYMYVYVYVCICVFLYYPIFLSVIKCSTLQYGRWRQCTNNLDASRQFKSKRRRRVSYSLASIFGVGCLLLNPAGFYSLVSHFTFDAVFCFSSCSQCCSGLWFRLLSVSLLPETS